MKSALLIGNDINNISSGYEWSELLKELIQYVGAQNKIQNLDEQFPLFYEEICTFALSNNTVTETEIKKFISDKVQKIDPNPIHKKLTRLDVSEILTTNYEFTLERSISNKSKIDFKNEGIVAENRYSVFRNHKVNNKRFWHIQGDAHNSNTITLGYEHYSGYLQSMRNYVVSGTRGSYKKIKLGPLTKRLINNPNEEIISWIDLVFNHDIHIVGLGLDFVEIHLWWLLTFRARAKYKKKILHSNKIYYYYPLQRESIDKTKLRLLKANDIELVSCDRKEKDKNKYYEKVVQELNLRIDNI